MRVTTGMLSGNLLSDLNRNLEKLARHQSQAASGKRLTKLSDDPVGIISSMRARTVLGRIEQYQKRVTAAKEQLTQTETTVMEMNEVVKKAYETAVQLSNGFLTGDDKTAAGELIRELRDHVMALGNDTFGEVYIFGGYNTTKPPFTLSDTGELLYNGLDLKDISNDALMDVASQNLEYEIGLGIRMGVLYNGAQLMGTGGDNIYAVLDDLYHVLKSDKEPGDVGAYIEKLQNSQSHLLSLAAEIGGKTNRLDLLETRYKSDKENYTKMKSNVEDIDEMEAILQYRMAQTVYTYSLEVGANILRTSLLDFLR